MKINSSIIKASLYAMLVGSLSACTANYQEINEDPYSVGQDEMGRDGYNISSALVSMQSWTIPTTVLTYQFTDCHLGGTLGGYLASSNPSFNNGHFATYSASDDWTRVLFNDIIPKLYSSHKLLKEVTADPVPLAIAEVIKVMAMHRVTDCYGPIPYSKIGVGGELKAPYDSQKDVYNKMFEELNAAITTLTSHRTESISANADKVYGGSVEKWIKLANSLKLRLAMRIVYADPTVAQQMAESAVNHEVGVMTSNADNAALSSFGKDGNPLYVITYTYNGGDLRVGADIASYMNGYADPRRDAYFTKSTFTVADKVTNDFHGLRSGITVPVKETAQKYSNVNLTPNSSLQWMNASEVSFLMAEAALNGWNVGATAENLYRKGVELSFGQWGVAGVETYLNSVSTPKSYTDPLGAFNNTGTISSISVKWSGTNKETNLERIITQKWIANFGLCQEAWAEYRRTGYPKLMPVIVNNSSTVDSDKGARRLNYPLNEYTSNAANVNTAVASYLGGPDNMGTRIWWDCKNN